MPIGGMAANAGPRRPKTIKALRDIWFDKLRAAAGLFESTAGLRHIARLGGDDCAVLREAGRDRSSPTSDLRRIPDKLTPDERKRLEALARRSKVSPLELAESTLTPESCSRRQRRKLLSRRKGLAEDGLRYAMYMSTEFMYQQLLGNNAAAIYDPRTGLRFMNDLATYEIFWHFLYLTVFHGVELTADGKYAKKGDRVTPELFLKLLDERRDTVKELFKLGTDYGKTNAELVLTILKRQVVETRPDGRVVPQPRWIKYGSRVLLAIIEEPEPDRSAILDAIFDGKRADLSGKALRAYDFVYDVREGATVSAA
jgi:malate synthase